jgi:benzoyl-CoA reductase subunit C
MEDMKHNQELREATANPSVYASRLKQESGKKVVGYVCSYLPEELIIAAGAHPLRLLGTKENVHLADSHLQSYCCSLVRGILEEALSRRSDFLDGMVFPHTCDSIQRLSDIWRMNIPVGFHLDCVFPVKLDTDSAREYMVAVLEKFRRDLEGKLDVRITEEELQRAIGLTNAIRHLMKEIYELRSKFPALMTGEELYTLVRASMILERGRTLAILSDIAEDLKTKIPGKETSPSPKRLFLAGGICNHPDIYPMIEEAGGAIVGDDFCTGARYFAGEIDEAAPSMAGIAGRLLNRVVCPAKHADFDGRARHIIRLVKETRAQGGVFLLLKFCDPHAFDFPYLKKSLEEAEIPVMLLEIDDPLPAEGQLKTRFEAFLEML